MRQKSNGPGGPAMIGQPEPGSGCRLNNISGSQHRGRTHAQVLRAGGFRQPGYHREGGAHKLMCCAIRVVDVALPLPFGHLLIVTQPDALQANRREDVTCVIGRERRKAGVRFLQELLG